MHHAPEEFMQQARESFNAGKYKETLVLLSKAEGQLHKLKGDARRDLAYDIWDLKTSVRLTTLA